ncbi:hypothetical protein ACFLZ3_00450, partial [Candidatus Omnitrophota bacterium]
MDPTLLSRILLGSQILIHLVIAIILLVVFWPTKNKKSKIEDLQKGSIRLSAQLTEKEQSLEDALSRKSQADEELKISRQKFLTLEQESQKTGEKLKKLQAESSVLESGYKSKVEQLQKENRQLATQVSRDEQELKGALSQKSKLEAELKQALTQKAAAQAGLNKADARLLKLEEEIRGMSSRLGQLRSITTYPDSDSKAKIEELQKKNHQL